MSQSSLQHKLLGILTFVAAAIVLWVGSVHAQGTGPFGNTVTVSGIVNANAFNAGATTAANNPIFTRISADGTNAVSATAGLYFNQLQGNAVLSATNGGFVNVLQSNAVLSGTNPLPVSTPQVSQANVTSKTDNVPNVDTAVTLTAASTHLVVKTDPSAAVVYVDVTNGAATTADFRIDPGGALTMDGLTPISSIHILGASATGTYSVAAW